MDTAFSFLNKTSTKHHLTRGGYIHKEDMYIIDSFNFHARYAILPRSIGNAESIFKAILQEDHG
jgi:hypothetical protein